MRRNRYSGSAPEMGEPFPGPDLSAPFPRRGGVLLLRLLIVIGLVVCAALIAWGVVRYRLPDSGAVPTVAERTDSFQVGELTVTVNGASWVALDTASRLWWADFDLLAVDVSVAGGDALDWDYPDGEVYLALDGGHYIPCLTDYTALELLRDMGITPVTPYDMLWADPLAGALLFYVPKGFDSAALCLEERTGKDRTERVEAIHTYALTLPDRGEGAP